MGYAPNKVIHPGTKKVLDGEVGGFAGLICEETERSAKWVCMVVSITREAVPLYIWTTLHSHFARRSVSSVMRLAISSTSSPSTVFLLGWLRRVGVVAARHNVVAVSTDWRGSTPRAAAATLMRVARSR